MPNDEPNEPPEFDPAFDLPDFDPLFDHDHLGFDPCDTTTWSPEQLAAMRLRFPLLCRDSNPPQVPGEHGTWISFLNGIPDDEADVLLTDGRCVHSALWQFDGIHFPDKTEDDEAVIEELTHWMKYPDPPST